MNWLVLFGLIYIATDPDHLRAIALLLAVFIASRLIAPPPRLP